jgi:hypothetical protein
MAAIALYDNLPDALNHIEVQDRAIKTLLTNYGDAMKLKDKLADLLSQKDQEIKVLKIDIENLKILESN